MVCYDVAIEPTLQSLAGEELNKGANKAPDACLDVHRRGFWETTGRLFFFFFLIYGYVTGMRIRTKSLAPNPKRSESMHLE